MLQSTWTDPVLGVDIHIVLVPTPAGPVPTPLPSPFTGMVYDPAGLAINTAMGGSIVLVNCLPATNCGTHVPNMPPHLPVPGPFQKGKLDDDAKLLFGALNVNINGTLAVRLGDIALSCNDPVRMPTSVVLAIPKGSIVLVMPPMVPDLALIVQELVFALLSVLRKLQKGSEWWAKVSKKLKFAEAEGSRAKQLWNDTVCFLTGHPVDVATGRVITKQTDLELGGTLALRFERRYDSAASHRSGTMAPGWAHTYGEALWPERGRFVYRDSDGREIEFSTLHLPDRVLNAGDSVFLPRERLTLRCARQYQYTVTDAKGTVREFFAVDTNGDARGRARLVRIRTRIGEEQRLTYGADGRLDTVIDAAGRSLRFEYDNAGPIKRVHVVGTDGRAELVGAYSYSASGDLIEARDALGHSYRYDYVEHLLVKETNKNGLSFYFQYDGVDSTAKCIRTWGDGGIYDHAITYTPDGTKTLVENSLGYITLYEMDPEGQVVAVTDALGRKTAYEYDDATGWKTAETDPTGAELRNEYDHRGNLKKILRPDGGEIVIDYDAMAQPVRAIDAIGGVWQWSYDGTGRLVGRVNSNAEQTRFEWDGPRLAGITDAAGLQTRFGYDASGGLTELATPDGSVARWTYDGLGRLRTSTDASGNLLRRHRDAVGRIERVEESDGNVRLLSYDGEGNLVRGMDKQHDVRFEYHGMNRLAVRAEASTRVEFHYDTEDRFTGIKNEHGFVHRLVLDGFGDVSEEHGFDGLRRRYVRDAAGRVTHKFRPEGRTTEYTYDLAGRLTGVLHSDGTGEVYKYRKDGAMVMAKNASSELTFVRDGVGRIVKEVSGDDWVASTFDAVGRRKQITSSKGLFARIRRNTMGDVVGLDAEVAESQSIDGTSPRSGGPRGSTGERLTTESRFSATFIRDVSGLEIERDLPGGIRARWHRDALGRPVRQEVWQGETSVSARQYIWGVGDRLEKLIDALSGPIEYHHDALGNLASARDVDGNVDLRLPDAVGNLFRTADHSDRKYGAAGQLLEARAGNGTVRYEYDSEGNLTRKIEPEGREWTYHWNASGLLVKVERPDGRLVEFTYDALARRLSKTYRTKTTRWLWDGNVPLHEWVEVAPAVQDDTYGAGPSSHQDAGDALKMLTAGRPTTGPPQHGLTAPDGQDDVVLFPITTWLFHPESFAPIAKIVNGESQSIITDHLGTPRAMYDRTGVAIWEADIALTGDLLRLRGDRQACPFRWPGQYEDEETGLYYNRFRYYDPSSGEYVAQDPIGLARGTALYAYVHDPLAWTDPLGLHVAQAWFTPQGGTRTPVGNPALGGANSWPNVRGSGGNDMAPSGLGRAGDSENRLMEHLQATRGGEMEGGVLEVVSTPAHGPSLPPCDMCDEGMQRFANEEKATVVYSQTRRGGEPTGEPRVYRPTGCG